MADIYAKLGLNPGLAEHFRIINCILKDLELWARQRKLYTWDALDIQNILSIAISKLVRWYIGNDPELSSFDNIMAICLFVFIFIVGLGRPPVIWTSAGGVVMPAINRHFLATITAALPEQN